MQFVFLLQGIEGFVSSSLDFFLSLVLNMNRIDAKEIYTEINIWLLFEFKNNNL